jgi:hypothetical protein
VKRVIEMRLRCLVVDDNPRFREEAGGLRDSNASADHPHLDTR